MADYEVRISKAISYATKALGYSELRPNQELAVKHNFLRGLDVFVSLPWIIHTNVDWKRCIIALRLRVRSTLTHFTVVRGCIYGDSTRGQRKAAVKLLKNNAKASFAST